MIFSALDRRVQVVTAQPLRVKRYEQNFGVQLTREHLFARPAALRRDEGARGSHHLWSANGDVSVRRAVKDVDPTIPILVQTLSIFAGSQRFAAVWAGDNEYKWVLKRAVVKYMLSNGV